jgi:hypothetical protein
MTSRYHVGDTIRLRASFYTFAGVLADPTNITVKVYDAKRNVVAQASGASIENPSTGVYYYDYTTDDEGEFTYEFSGLGEGTTILRRGIFVVKFVG